MKIDAILQQFPGFITVRGPHVPGRPHRRNAHRRTAPVVVQRFSEKTWTCSMPQGPGNCERPPSRARPGRREGQGAVRRAAPGGEAATGPAHAIRLSPGGSARSARHGLQWEPSSPRPIAATRWRTSRSSWRPAERRGPRKPSARCCSPQPFRQAGFPAWKLGGNLPDQRPFHDPARRRAPAADGDLQRHRP